MAGGTENFSDDFHLTILVSIKSWPIAQAQVMKDPISDNFCELSVERKWGSADEGDEPQVEELLYISYCTKNTPWRIKILMFFSKQLWCCSAGIWNSELPQMKPSAFSWQFLLSLPQQQSVVIATRLIQSCQALKLSGFICEIF